MDLVSCGEIRGATRNRGQTARWALYVVGGGEVSMNAFLGEGANPLTRPLEQAVRALRVLDYIEAWLDWLVRGIGFITLLWLLAWQCQCVSAPADCPNQSGRDERCSGPALCSFSTGPSDGCCGGVCTEVSAILSPSPANQLQRGR